MSNKNSDGRNCNFQWLLPRSHGTRTSQTEVLILCPTALIGLTSSGGCAYLAVSAPSFSPPVRQKDSGIDTLIPASGAPVCPDLSSQQQAHLFIAPVSSVYMICILLCCERRSRGKCAPCEGGTAACCLHSVVCCCRHMTEWYSRLLDMIPPPPLPHPDQIK